MSPLLTHASLAVPAFIQGLALSLGLIVAIGAQNAFVLRQGLRREHVGSVVLFCALADGVLIAAGVLGMAQALGDRPGLARALALAGALFLAAYGVQALRRARRSHSLRAAKGLTGLGRGAVLAHAAAFTLLNPLVYLDTVLLVGSIVDGALRPSPLGLHPTRPNHTNDSTPAAIASTAETSVTTPDSSVSRVSTCTRVPRFW